MIVWVDADATPRGIREALSRAASRRQIDGNFVANRPINLGRGANLTMTTVGQGADVADDYIAEHCQPGDLVLTADIPLAARVIEAGGTVLRFRGEPLTEANVRQRLNMRDFMDELRGEGVMTGGPPPYGPKDKQRFANALDRWLSRNR